MWPFKPKVNQLEEERELIVRTSEVRELERLTQRVDDLNAQLDKYSAENENLISERRKLQEEVEDLKLKKKIETEDIEHMVTMKLEKAEIEKDRAIMEANADAEKKVNEAREEFNKELKDYLQKSNKDSEKRFEKLMERMSKVQMSVARGDWQEE